MKGGSEAQARDSGTMEREKRRKHDMEERREIRGGGGGIEEEEESVGGDDEKKINQNCLRFLGIEGSRRDGERQTEKFNECARSLFSKDNKYSIMREADRVNECWDVSPKFRFMTCTRP